MGSMERGGGLTIQQAVKGIGRCPCQCHTLTSLRAASPAKTSPTPAKVQDSTECARVFGQSAPVLFANYDPDTSSWKTSQLCLLGDSKPFSGTWPRSGMTRNGIAYRLAPLAPLTGGTASGLWPTPHRICQPGPRQPGPSGNELGRAVNRVETWTTPTAWLGRRPDHAVGKAERFTNPERSYALSDQVAARGTSGSLNPTWVEWLMNFPLGWTEVD